MDDNEGMDNKKVVAQELIQEIEPRSTKHRNMSLAYNKYLLLHKLSGDKCFFFLSPPLSTMVLKSMSPRWLSSHSAIHTHVDVLGMNALPQLPQELTGEIVSQASPPLDVCGKLLIVSKSFWSAAKSDNVWDRFLLAELISYQAVSDQWMHCDPWKKIDSTTLQNIPSTKKDMYLFLSENPLIIDDSAMSFWLDKLCKNNCLRILSPPPLSSQTTDLYDAVNLEFYKKISTSMLTPNTVDTADNLFDFTSSLFFDEYKDQPLKLCVRTNDGCQSQNWIVYINIMPPVRSTMVLKSLSTCWLSFSSHNKVHTHVDLMGDVLGMNALPQELIEKIVSHTSPLDACGKLSILSRNFCSAAKCDHVWERFLPADATDLISRRAVSNDSPNWMWGCAVNPWKNIDSDTLQAFPTKKDLYLFLSDYRLAIDDGDMYFWLDKLSGKKCFQIVPEKLSIPEPDGWNYPYSYVDSRLPFEIYGKISTSLLSPNTTYAAYLVFDFTFSTDFSGFGKEKPLETCVWIDGGCQSEKRNVYIPFLPYIYGSSLARYILRRSDMTLLPAPPYPEWRDDGWYEVELGDYFNKEGGDNKELHMSLREANNETGKGGIALKGIEIRPKNCKITS